MIVNGIRKSLHRVTEQIPEDLRSSKVAQVSNEQSAALTLSL